ncbi:hypothetical protein [Nonomuraea typhae]|uniref:hypothetical protein n=1 Tax=Nonomuraea typhae TaxID=2603600 RepID=UPI0012F8A53C|nr:hypothetical protein [Nonomuraea typhae]
MAHTTKQRWNPEEEWIWANQPAHPPIISREDYEAAQQSNVLLQEIDLAPKLDEYLGRLLTPWSINWTLHILGHADEVPAPALLEAESLKREIADCDRKLKGYRAALDAGAAPVTVAEWMKDEQARKATLERRLNHLPVGRPRRFDREAMAATLRQMGDMVAVLTKADPARKTKVYAELGLVLTFDPGKHEVLVAATSDQDSHWVRASVRGGT